MVKLKNRAKKITPTVAAIVAPKTVDLKYHVIVGCFSEKANARSVVKNLNKRGLNAWIVGKRKNLWTVSYSSYATRKEAITALTSAQSSSPNAWILNQ